MYGLLVRVSLILFDVQGFPGREGRACGCRANQYSDGDINGRTHINWDSDGLRRGRDDGGNGLSKETVTLSAGCRHECCVGRKWGFLELGISLVSDGLSYIPLMGACDFFIAEFSWSMTSIAMTKFGIMTMCPKFL